MTVDAKATREARARKEPPRCEVVIDEEKMTPVLRVG
jgi:hypothetical protein